MIGVIRLATKNTTHNTTMPKAQVTPQSDSTATAKPEPSFGDGRYSPLMRECYKDAQLILKLHPEQAEKLARLIGTEYGAIMAGVGVGMSGVKFGKANKDMQVTISEAATKVKNVTLSPAMTCLRAMAWANECGKFGFVRSSWDVEVMPRLQEWFANHLPITPEPELGEQVPE